MYCSHCDAEVEAKPGDSECPVCGRHMVAAVPVEDKVKEKLAGVKVKPTKDKKAKPAKKESCDTTFTAEDKDISFKCE